MLYAELTSSELGRAAPHTIALLPIASIEQHGPHLPVCVDTALIGEIARQAESTLPRHVALLPTLWVGSSHHHRGFPGAVSLSSETYIQALMEMVECLADTGFRRIALLNGHGGNDLPCREALFRLNQKWQGPREPWVALVSYWNLAARELASQKFMKTRILTHACEYETSMMLALRADWVKMRLAKADKRAFASKYYHLHSDEPRPVVGISKSFHQRTRTGAMGAPELASAEKGRKLFGLIMPVIIDFLTEFRRWKLPRERTKERNKVKSS